jgi:hypothetical protein
MFVTVTVIIDVCPIINGRVEAKPNEIGSGAWAATNPIAAVTSNDVARTWIVLLNSHTTRSKIDSEVKNVWRRASGSCISQRPVYVSTG